MWDIHVPYRNKGLKNKTKTEFYFSKFNSKYLIQEVQSFFLKHKVGGDIASWD